MHHDTQDLIRARAHQIWEREGRPDGRHIEHWELATAELAAEAKPAKKPAALAKAGTGKASKKIEPAAVAPPGKRAARKTAVAA
jgi:hypothetical protein